MCPVGAVSSTTKPPLPASTVRAKARKTAISSVHGERRSSSSRALPCVVEVLARGRHHLGRVLGGLLGRVDAADGEVRHPRRRA